MEQSVALQRKALKKQRAQLPIQHQKALSKRAVKHLQRSQQFRSARHIAIYLPVRGEIDPVSLRHYANPRQTFYLPVLSPYKPHGLVFIRWNTKTRFRMNRFNIPEPLIRKKLMVSARALDLVVTPLLAFDKRGNRLGMGGGFYDRSFAFKLKNPTRQRPSLTGIAYQFQQVGTLARQSWDVPLNAIATESQFTEFRNSPLNQRDA